VEKGSPGPGLASGIDDNSISMDLVALNGTNGEVRVAARFPSYVPAVFIKKVIEVDHRKVGYSTSALLRQRRV